MKEVLAKDADCVDRDDLASKFDEDILKSLGLWHQ